MSKKNNDVLIALRETILLAIDKKISKAPYDKTVRGRISAKISNNKYEVMINGTTYIAKSNSLHSIGDVVNTVIPLNNYNEMFIMSNELLNPNNMSVTDISGLLTSGWKLAYSDSPLVLINLGRFCNIKGLITCVDTTYSEVASSLPFSSAIYNGAMCECLTSKTLDSIYLAVNPASQLVYQNFGDRVPILNQAYVVNIVYYTE